MVMVEEDTATVGFCLSDEANVTATVTNGAGTTVRTLESSQDTVTPAWCSPYNGGQAQLTWDGTSDSGATVPDGSYTLRIHAVDAYSQSGDATTDFDVDTQPPGTLTTPSSGASLTGSASWSFAPTSGFSVSAVYVYCGSGAASASATTESGGAFSGSLDTTGCPNGTDSIYAVASWTDAFGNAHSWTSPATSVSVQNTPPPPSISIEYGGNTEFSPNGDGQEDTATVGFCLSDEANVTATVTNGAGTTVRTLESSQDTVTPAWCSPYNGGQAQLTWDGTSDSGATVPDGSYTLRIHAVDAYSQSGDATTDFDVDTQPPGTLTTPSSGDTLAGLIHFALAPTAGVTINSVSASFSTGGVAEIYNPSPDGIWRTTMYASALQNGPATLTTQVQYTDAFGNAHYWSAPAIPVTINVSSLPLSLTADTNSGPAPLTTNFSVATSDPAARTVHYTLAFGDGTSTSGDIAAPYTTPTIQHTYSTPGTYDAIATVSNSVGAESTASIVIAATSAAPPPQNTVVPQIRGGAQAGKALTEVHGAWANGPVTYSLQWQRCDATGANCKDLPGQSEPTYTPTSDDVGSTIAVNETASNTTGPSVPAASAPTAVVVGEGPSDQTAPTITGTAQTGRTLSAGPGTWSPTPDSYDYQWERCNTVGLDCHAIAGANGAGYTLTPADITSTIVVQVTGLIGQAPGDLAASSPSATVTAAPLNADAGDPISTTTGAPATFDATGSTPADLITDYSWDFGDGTTANGATVQHTYGKAGSYTARVTVTEAGATASATVAVNVMASATGTMVTVEDPSGAAISGASVIYIGSNATQTSATTGQDGTADLQGLPDGSDTVYAWANGYQVGEGQVAVAGGSGSATVQLQSGQVATTTLKSTQLTEAQIATAGIDTSDPDNENVYQFTVALHFPPKYAPTPQPPSVSGYINGAGRFVGGTLVFYGGGGGTGVAGVPCQPTACSGPGFVAIPEIVDGQPLIEWLILKGSVTTLKQFFSVDMVVNNLSADPVKLADGTATINRRQGSASRPQRLRSHRRRRCQRLTVAPVPTSNGSSGETPKASTTFRPSTTGRYSRSALRSTYRPRCRTPSMCGAPTRCRCLSRPTPGHLLRAVHITSSST